MLRKTTDIIGFDIAATDGTIGHVDDFYFDDEDWTIRYLVVDTGPWLFGRRVLIAASVLDEPRWEDGSLPVHLSKKQVENSPDIDLTAPVSRQRETELYEHYRWPLYWSPVTTSIHYPATGMAIPPQAPVAEKTHDPGKPESLQDELQAIRRAAATQTSGLRSVKEVTGYDIVATDDRIGHVDDFFVDEADWIIRFMLVDTRNWLPGRKVLVSPDWITEVRWDERDVYLKVTKQKVKESPEYDPKEPPSRSYVHSLHGYYGFPMY